MALPPAAQLRILISDSFDQEELHTLCFDLDVDYESLPGEGKVARVRAMIEHFARRKRMIELIDHCVVLREKDQSNWAMLRVVAQTTPDVFLPDAVEVPESLGTGGIITVPANRAVKLAFASGALVVMLFGCGLVSGLLASRVVSINPVPASEKAAQYGIRKIWDLQRSAAIVQIPAAPNTNPDTLPDISNVVQSRLSTNSEEITSIADKLIRSWGNKASVRDVHVRFEQNQTVVTFRSAQTNRQMAIAYTVETQRGRLVFTPQSAWVHLIEIRGSTIGWFPIPVSWASEMTTWIQKSIDQLTDDFYFTRIDVRQDALTIAGVRTRR